MIIKKLTLRRAINKVEKGSIDYLLLTTIKDDPKNFTNVGPLSGCKLALRYLKSKVDKCEISRDNLKKLLKEILDEEN